MAKSVGIERIAFGTVTIDPKNDMSPDKAQKQWHSWWSHQGCFRYSSAVKVVEVQKNGRIHFHFVGVTHEDIQTGTHIDSKDSRRIQLVRMNKACRDENLWLSKSVQRYGFGKIASVEPVKKNIEAVAKYLSDYLTKSPLPESWGRKRSYELCGEVKGKVGSSFHWCTPRSWLRRKKIELAELYMCFEPGDLLECLGSKGYYFIEGDLSDIRFPLHEAMEDPVSYRKGIAGHVFKHHEGLGLRELRREAWGSDERNYKRTMRALGSISRKVCEALAEGATDHPRPEDVAYRGGYTWKIPEGLDPSDVPF